MPRPRSRRPGVTPAGWRVEVVEHRPGTAWVLERPGGLTRRHRARLAVDRHGPAAPVVDELRRAGVATTVLTTDEYAADCAALLLDVLEDADPARPGIPRLAHGRQADLDAAAGTAGRRPLGERWAWARASGELSTLEAVTLAAGAARRRRTTRPEIV